MDEPYGAILGHLTLNEFDTLEVYFYVGKWYAEIVHESKNGNKDRVEHASADDPAGALARLDERLLDG